MRVAWLVLASGVMDFTAYVFFLCCAIDARKAHGFDEAWLLLLGAGYDAVYATSCLVTAGWSEGRPRGRFLLAGAVGAAGAAAWAMAAGHPAALLGAVACMGLALSQYWPPMQARLGDLAPGSATLQRVLGAFNLSWCTGKALGFILAARLVSGAGVDAGFALAMGGATLAGLLAWGGAAGPVTPRPGTAADPAPASGRPPGFLAAARVANFVAWGGGALLVWAVEKRAVALDLGTEVAGVALGSVFVAQAVTNTVLGASAGWRYRLFPLLALQAVGAAGFAGLALATATLPFCAAAAACGVGLGIAYSASIFYALDRGTSRSHGTAIHEVVLGAGGVTIPLAGAGLARWTGAGAAPFALVAGMTCAGLAVQAWCVRRRAPAAPAGPTGSR